MGDLLPPGEDILLLDDNLNMDTANGTIEKGQEQADTVEGLSDLDSDEDDVQVTIKALSLAPTSYSGGFMKKGPVVQQEKGKFAPEDFDGLMSINGVPAIDFNLEAIDDKPWRKPGADLTDFFNFGFTEDTWNTYCDRQKRLRTESGVGTFTVIKGGSYGGHFQPSTIVNENSKYNTVTVVKRSAIQSSLPIKAIPTLSTTKIDVIGVSATSRRSESDLLPPGDDSNVPNLSMPPPIMPAETVPVYESFSNPEYSYYGYVEPTQSAQWTPQDPWQPPPLGVPPPIRVPQAGIMPPSMVPPPVKIEQDTEAITPPPPGADERDPLVRDLRRSRSPDDEAERKRKEYRERAREREKEREREVKEKERKEEKERERERERERDRDKERERRERKERRRREKSTSRSPTRHKKSKKSKRHSDSD